MIQNKGWFDSPRPTCKLCERVRDVNEEGICEECADTPTESNQEMNGYIDICINYLREIKKTHVLSITEEQAYNLAIEDLFKLKAL